MNPDVTSRAPEAQARLSSGVLDPPAAAFAARDRVLTAVGPRRSASYTVRPSVR
jgi:hypothetical protein